MKRLALSIHLFFAFLLLSCGSLQAGEKAFFSSFVSFQGSGGKLTINGFPVADLPYGGDPAVNSFSNDAVSGYLKNGQNRLIFFFQPIDAATKDGNAAYGSFNLQRGETEMFSLSLPPPPLDLAEEIADQRASLVQGNLNDDSSLIFANPKTPEESWVMEINFTNIQGRFTPRTLFFFDIPEELRALDVSFGASGADLIKAPLLPTEHEYEKTIDLSELPFPNNAVLSRITLTAGRGEGYWKTEPETQASELSVGGILLEPRAERQTVVIELALADISRRIWEEADTLEEELDDVDRQALMQLAESLHHALKGKDVDAITRLYTGKIRALSEMTLRSPVELAANLRSFFTQTLFSQPTWKIAPMPPQDQILFEVYENRKIVELRLSQTSWLFESDTENGQFQIPFKCLKANGAWLIYE